MSDKSDSDELMAARMALAMPPENIDAMRRRSVFRCLDEINVLGDRLRYFQETGEGSAEAVTAALKLLAAQLEAMQWMWNKAECFVWEYADARRRMREDVFAPALTLALFSTMPAEVERWVSSLPDGSASVLDEAKAVTGRVLELGRRG
jgi:hypothetical protein